MTQLCAIAVMVLLGAVGAAAQPPHSPVAPAPDQSPAASEPSKPAESSALARLSAEARAKASRRAKFVYRMPDGTVWDSAAYCEFRDVLREFDATPKGTQPGPRARAWGFAADSRRIGGEKERPHPLWHTLAPGRHDRTPFIYINTAHVTAADKGHGVMARIEEEVADRWFVVYVHEFPKNEIGRLPFSFPYYGSSRVLAFVPREVAARVGGSLDGEFFFVSDPELVRPKDAPDGHSACRFVHAAKLRLNPEQYAAALLAGEVEMIEWSFKRTTDRMGEKFEWTRRVVEARGDGAGDGGEAGKPNESEAVPEKEAE